MSEIKVLCVEHHAEYMGALKYMLETVGYEVMPATTGEQALNLIRAHAVWVFCWNMICPMPAVLP